MRSLRLTRRRQHPVGYVHGQRRIERGESRPRPDGATSVTYDYCDYSPGGSKITKITDKAGVATYFDLYHNAAGVCTKIVASLPSGLVTTYERSLATGVCVIKNWDGETLLSRHDNWPVSTSVPVSKRKDYYTGVSTYQRWDNYFKYAAEGKTLTPVTGPGTATVAHSSVFLCFFVRQGIRGDVRNRNVHRIYCLAKWRSLQWFMVYIKLCCKTAKSVVT
jgi:hypothetical protein